MEKEVIAPVFKDWRITPLLIKSICCIKGGRATLEEIIYISKKYFRRRIYSPYIKLAISRYHISFYINGKNINNEVLSRTYKDFVNNFLKPQGYTLKDVIVQADDFIWIAEKVGKEEALKRFASHPELKPYFDVLFNIVISY